jgi:hypothetical protein
MNQRRIDDYNENILHPNRKYFCFPAGTFLSNANFTAFKRGNRAGANTVSIIAPQAGVKDSYVGWNVMV